MFRGLSGIIVFLIFGWLIVQAQDLNLDCDDAVERFENGTFQVFDSRCADGDLFYTIKYSDNTEIPRPNNTTEYFATANRGRHCMKNRLPIAVVPGSSITIDAFKTKGELLCTVTIKNNNDTPIVENKLLRLSDNVWSYFEFEIENEDNITLEMTCDFIDQPRLAIDNVMIINRCVLTTSEIPSTTTDFTSTTDFITTTEELTTEITETTEVTTEVTSTTTKATTTITTTSIPIDCNDVIDDFSEGDFGAFGDDCNFGTPFPILPYANLTNVPEPPNGSNGYFASASVGNPCMRSSKTIGVVNGSIINLHLFNNDGLSLCSIIILDEEGTLIDTEVLEIEDGKWLVYSNEIDEEENVFVEFACNLAGRPNFVIDYIEIKNRCRPSNIS